MRWYAYGPEKGVTDLLTAMKPSLRLEGVSVSGDKFVRALAVAAAWNGDPATGRAGRVFVPRSAPWLDTFVSELAGFTGINDAHDDQVDALAAAYDALATSAPIAASTAGERRWGGARTI
jgi:predicted phage terminase large subunit-like protein